MTDAEIESVLGAYETKWMSNVNVDVYEPPVEILEYVGDGNILESRSNFIMKVFSEDVLSVVYNVPVEINGKISGEVAGTASYKFDDYFELAGYIRSPFDFEEAGSITSRNPLTTNKLILSTIKGRWGNQTTDWQGMSCACSGGGNTNISEVTLPVIQSTNTSNLYYGHASATFNGNGQFYIPKGYWVQGYSCQCEEKYGKVSGFFRKLFGGSDCKRYASCGMTAVNASPDGFDRTVNGCKCTNNSTFYNSSDPYPDYTDPNNMPDGTVIQSNIIHPKAEDNYKIPIYKAKTKFTTGLINIPEYNLAQTGEWNVPDLAGMYFIKYNDTIHKSAKYDAATRKWKVESNIEPFKIEKGNITTTTALKKANMFRNYTNLWILPPPLTELAQKKQKENVNIDYAGMKDDRMCLGLSTVSHAIHYSSMIPEFVGDTRPNEEINNEEENENEPFRPGLMHSNIYEKEKILKRNNKAITMYRTKDDIYYFDEVTFEYWFDQIMQTASLKKILEDAQKILTVLNISPLVKRIKDQMEPLMEEKGINFSFIDLPLGPPLVTIPNYQCCFNANKFMPSIQYIPNVIGENTSYDSNAFANCICNKVLSTTTNAVTEKEFNDTVNEESVQNYSKLYSGHVKGNYLDDFMQGQLTMCGQAGTTNDIIEEEAQRVYVLYIPRLGAQITDIINYNASIYKDKVYSIEKDDENLCMQNAYTRMPAILMSRRKLDNKQLDSFQYLGEVHVPIFTVKFSNLTGAYELKFSSLTKDYTVDQESKNLKGDIVTIQVPLTADNSIFIYVTKPNKCNGKYLVSNLYTKIDTNTGKQVQYFTIDYNGEEIPSVPISLEMRV